VPVCVVLVVDVVLVVVGQCTLLKFPLTPVLSASPVVVLGEPIPPIRPPPPIDPTLLGICIPPTPWSLWSYSKTCSCL
jgi:hypothetical protein